jgi:hypothetical protein
VSNRFVLLLFVLPVGEAPYMIHPALSNSCGILESLQLATVSVGAKAHLIKELLYCCLP